MYLEINRRRISAGFGLLVVRVTRNDIVFIGKSRGQSLYVYGIFRVGFVSVRSAVIPGNSVKVIFSGVYSVIERISRRGERIQSGVFRGYINRVIVIARVLRRAVTLDFVNLDFARVESVLKRSITAYGHRNVPRSAVSKIIQMKSVIRVVLSRLRVPEIRRVVAVGVLPNDIFGFKRRGVGFNSILLTCRRCDDIVVAVVGSKFFHVKRVIAYRNVRSGSKRHIERTGNFPGSVGL